MPDTAQYLSVAKYSPRIGWDNDVAVNPTIKVWFNIAVDTSFVNTDARLNQYVILVRMDDDSPVPVLFSSWDATTKLLSITTSGNLIAGEIYQITLRKELRSSTGRGMVSDFTWTFQVSSAALSRVSLLSPGDATAFSQAPSLIWQGVWIPSGVVHYDVQVDLDWKFHSLTFWSTTLTVSGSGGVHSSNIGTSLSDRTAYYWRVRARTSPVTGDWSDVRSFFIGTQTQPSPDTELLFQPDLDFVVEEILPTIGTTHQVSFPTLQVTFTQKPSGASINEATFYLLEEPVDGRFGGASGRVVAATRAIAGRSIFMTPTESIKPNSRYTLFVTKSVLSTGGVYLASTVTTYFSSKYMPLYGGTIAVRAELGGFIDEISDDEIHFQMWRASLEVNELLYTRIHQVATTATLESILNYVPAAITYGMQRYAELTAAISLLDSEYYEILRDAGRERQLSVFSYRVTTDVLEELRERIKDLKKERDEVAIAYLLKVLTPRVVIKSQYWTPDTVWMRDYSHKPRSEF